MRTKLPSQGMMGRSDRRTMLLFAGLSAYIVLQFVWWGVLLLRKDREVTQLALEVSALGGATNSDPDGTRGLRMILGEGTVLLALLLIGLYLTFRAIRRDLALARAQRNFLLAVTHELRTPIAAIKLQLQTLGRTELAHDQQRVLRSQAIEEADRLSRLTDKVLLATQAEEGVLTLELAEVDVMATVRELVDRLREPASHELLCTGPQDLRVQSDREALRSIVGNLLENAVKYAPAGSTISVEVVRGRDGWRLLVSDDGPGIPAEDHERVFERFFRSGSEETRMAKGTGLGLYIVKRLVQRLGGTIQLLPRQPQGSTFAASFPDR